LVIEEPSIELVAVNDLAEAENLAYLLRFDTVSGRYPKPVVADGDDLVVAGRKLRTLRTRDPLDLPWTSSAIRARRSSILISPRSSTGLWSRS
jgi:glyceraldehyde 3-phosphate dehydrogenase